MNKRIISLALVSFLCISCASHKGSSSLGKSSAKSSKVVSSPKVKSEERLANEKAQAEAQSSKQREVVEANAEKAKHEADKLKAEAELAAQKSLEQAKSKAAEEEARLAAEAKAREESVKVIETKSVNEGRYFVIVGSFKSLENARAASEKVISQGYTPSIMENDEGLYRVAIFNAVKEGTARTKLAQIKMKHSEYGDAWLLIKK